MIEATIVRGDDWCGLYINGKLVEENHSFSVDWVETHFVGKTLKSFETISAEGYVEDRGNLPYSLSEVIPD